MQVPPGVAVQVQEPSRRWAWWWVVWGRLAHKIQDGKAGSTTGQVGRPSPRRRGCARKSSTCRRARVRHVHQKRSPRKQLRVRFASVLHRAGRGCVDELVKIVLPARWPHFSVVSTVYAAVSTTSNRQAELNLSVFQQVVSDSRSGTLPHKIPMPEAESAPYSPFAAAKQFDVPYPAAVKLGVAHASYTTVLIMSLTLAPSPLRNNGHISHTIIPHKYQHYRKGKRLAIHQQRLLRPST